MAQLNEVFGVSKDMVLSYIEREQVDGTFREALKSDKHIIVYGSSKQGKSSLRQKHLNEENEVLIQCGPQHDTSDIYASILRQLGVQLETTSTEKNGANGEVNTKVTVKAAIPFIGEGGVELGGKAGDTTERTINYKSVDINIELAQDIGELIKATGKNKFVVLENFHYLDDEVQKKLAFDLRSFQEIGVRFIVLGIWRERNRLNQFNGDLVDRIIEIPIEPWEDNDFTEVIRKGTELLNIRFSDDVTSRIKEMSFGNIGIVQELCKQFCMASEVSSTKAIRMTLDEQTCLDIAVAIKVQDYSSRHLRCLESIADASRLYERGLFLPYYIVKVIVQSDVNDLKQGLQRADIHTKIRDAHYRPNDVRTGDMTNLLHGLGSLQSKKSIVPPLFDYDRSNRTLRVIDSTLLFFLRFTDKQEVLDEIPDPSEDLE